MFASNLRLTTSARSLSVCVSLTHPLVPGLSFPHTLRCLQPDCLGLGCDKTGAPDFQCSDIESCVCSKIVPYTTLSFCTVIESCRLAKLDLEFAKSMVQLYSQVGSHAHARGDTHMLCDARIVFSLCSQHIQLHMRLCTYVRVFVWVY